jgi:hypothetical protein
MMAALLISWLHAFVYFAFMMDEEELKLALVNE